MAVIMHQGWISGKRLQIHIRGPLRHNKSIQKQHVMWPLSSAVRRRLTSRGSPAVRPLRWSGLSRRWTCRRQTDAWQREHTCSPSTNTHPQETAAHVWLPALSGIVKLGIQPWDWMSWIFKCINPPTSPKMKYCMSSHCRATNFIPHLSQNAWLRWETYVGQPRQLWRQYQAQLLF